MRFVQAILLRQEQETQSEYNDIRRGRHPEVAVMLEAEIERVQLVR